MYVRATSMRFSRGRSTPTRRAMCSSPTCLEGLIRHLAAPGSPQGRRSLVLRVAGSRRWRRLFIYVVPAVRAAPSRGRRCLGRTGSGGVTRSALALLVTGIRADDHDARVATDHLAVVTDRLDARLNLHCFLHPGQSLVAVDDAAPVEVVGAELDDHGVLGKDADVVLGIGR